MDFLKEIISNKRKEISCKKKRMRFIDLIKGRNSELRDFKGSIKSKGISLIAEIKRMSPSTGIIVKKFNPSRLAHIYESAGADVISVITDKRYFGGKDEYIELVKKKSCLPVLRKDFIIDEFQIFESFYLGADGILFIARILSLSELKNFINVAHSLGLTTVVEVHTLSEIKKAISTDTDVIGTNNRNLNNFMVDTRISLKLRKFIPDCYLTVSESGIRNAQEVEKLKKAGFDAILVGTSLLQADNISKKILELKGKG
ncbi:MAG: indole-3-glycerol phosphate synthase TrpC [candidate division WOR-3 bacterium]